MIDNTSNENKQLTVDKVLLDKFLEYIELYNPTDIELQKFPAEDVNLLLECCFKEKLIEKRENKYYIKETKESESIDLLTLLDKEFPSRVWIVDKIIPKDSIGGIVAPRSSYKSWFAYYTTICLSEGLPLFNKIPTQKTNILYIDMESSQETIQERLRMIVRGLGIKLTNRNTQFISFTHRKIDNSEDLRYFIDLIKKSNIDCVIIDTFKRVHNKKENQADEISLLFTEYIRKLQLETNSTIILIHHTKKKPQGSTITDKMDMVRGSSEIVNYIDWLMMLERKGKSNFILLSHEKGRFGPEIETMGIQLNFNSDEHKVNFDLVPETEWYVSETPFTVKKIKEWIVSNNIGSFKTRDVKEYLKTSGESFNNKTVNHTIDVLIDEGYIRKIKRGNYEVVTTELNTFIKKS